MKELIGTVKHLFLVNRSEILVYGSVTVGFGIFGMVVVLVMLASGSMEGEYLKLGTLVAMLFSIIVLLFSAIFSLKTDFDLAISMGRTRKCFVPARYLLCAADCMVCMVGFMLISRMEDAVYRFLYPEAVSIWNVDVLFAKPVCWVGFLLATPALIMLMGGLFIKFSTKFFWFFWVVWMVCWLGGPRILSASEESPDSLSGRMGTDVLAFFRQITESQIMTALIIFLIVSAVAVALIFRKQRVTL